MNTVTPKEALAQLQALLSLMRGEAVVRLEGRGFEHRWRIVAGPEKAAGPPAQGRETEPPRQPRSQPLPFEPQEPTTPGPV